jgi:ATP-dependent DNA helicase RecQ
VLKAVHCLPRPLILYVTKVEDADAWAARLRASGLRRVGAVTGKSSDVERRSVMEQWRGSPGAPTGYDVVVGTSAFGLGLDMPNVRTVIHSCLPETVDRYYQEVGRAGRDGRPSIAYMAVGPGDRRIAERLNMITMIGDELGWNRWQELLRSGRPLTDLRYRVRKSALPMHLDEGYGRSKQWNVRTLTLMAQAGIIRLRVPQWIPEPDLTDGELDASRSAFFEEVEDYIEFELVNGEFLNRAGWTSAMGRVRQEVRDAQERALKSALELARAQGCVGRSIAAHYRVRDGGGVLVTQPACRGCPSCRRNPSSAPPAPPEPVPSLPEPRTGRDPLVAWRGASPSLFVWYEDGEDTAPLLVRMAQRAVKVFSGLERHAAERLQRASAHTPVVLDDPSSAAPLMLTYSGPIVVVVREPRIPPALIERARLGLVSYIIAPEETPNPDRPRWLRRDSQDAISASALMKEL